MKLDYKIVLRGLALGLLSILVLLPLPYVLNLFGLPLLRPAVFFSTVCGFSEIISWIVFWAFTSVMALAYIKYHYLSKLKHPLINGLVWGVVFFIFSLFVVTITIAMAKLSKEVFISAYMINLSIINIIIGLVVAYVNWYVYKRSLR